MPSGDGLRQSGIVFFFRPRDAALEGPLFHGDVGGGIFHPFKKNAKDAASGKIGGHNGKRLGRGNPSDGHSGRLCDFTNFFEKVPVSLVSVAVDYGLRPPATAFGRAELFSFFDS